MQRFLFPLALSLLVVAPTRGAEPSMAAAAAPDEAKAELVRYHWRLQAATDANGNRIDALFVQADEPLQLDFSADGGVFVGNACNDIGGDYSLDGESLTVANMSSTLMACVDPKLMALDREIGKRLDGELSLLAGDQPTLTLVSASGDKLVFTGKLIGERLSIEVAAHTQPCKPALAVVTQCLQIRPVKYDDSDGSFDAIGPYENFYGGIEGLIRKEGVRYVLGVERFAIENPSSDRPRYRYVLEWIFRKDATGK